MRCVIFSGRRPLTLLSSGPCLDPQGVRFGHCTYSARVGTL
jgi:hypothetical protein